MTRTKINWSVVVPAYNEAQRLPKTLAHIARYIREHRPGGMIMVVDDGSRDETSAIVTEYSKNNPDVMIELYRHSSNRGKGAAVRTGMRHSVGEWVAFIDADDSLPIEALDEMVPQLAYADIVISSKYLRPSKDTNHQAFVRTVIARGGNWLVRLFLGIHFSDTQCGLKLFRIEVAHTIFRRMTVNQWGFDIETLFLARRLGYQVVEVPIRWVDTDDSRVSPLPAAFRTIMELIKIRWNAWRGVYDNERSEAK